MTNKNTKAKRGFTIIEVVLVLAIAGLIFLMVFVALPTLQRNQRDTARKNDMDRLHSALVSYVSNNNRMPGAVPTSSIVYTRVCVDTTDTECEQQTTLDNADSKGWLAFVNNYLIAEDDTFNDQNGDAYKLAIITNTASAIGNSTDGVLPAAKLPAVVEQFKKYTGGVVVALNASCQDDDATPIIVRDSDGRKSFAIAMRLEAGGIYCLDN